MLMMRFIPTSNVTPKLIILSILFSLSSCTADDNSTGIPALGSSLTIISHNLFPSQHALCRIKGVCRIGDGTFLLPQWMEAYSAHISKCGLSEIAYTLTDSEGEDEDEDGDGDEDEASRTYATKPHDSIALKDAFRDFDVLGLPPPHAERNLLVSDLTPAILLLDVFKRPLAYVKTTQTLCTTAEGKKCSLEEFQGEASLNAMLLVDARVAETKDYLWPKSFLRLLRNAADGKLLITDLKDLYGWKVRSEAACFRSVISTDVNLHEIPREALLESNVFFATNGLNRRAVDTDVGASCTVKTLILNRYGKRFIEGADQLSRAIATYGRELWQKDRRVLLEPEVVFFENSSFHEQVAVMQESRIVVASHGDGNANLAFLRPGAHVFELLPFGLASDMYKNLSTTFGGVYSHIVAQPDHEVFTACVQHFNPKASKQRDTFLHEWTQAAQAFSNNTLHHKRNLASNYTIPDDDTVDNGLARLRQCASHQRISVDVKHVARLVNLAAAEQCHVKANLSFLID